MKRGEGRRKIDCIVYSCVFRTPPIISPLRCPLLWQRLIVVHFWKIARHECAFKIAGVSGSSSPSSPSPHFPDPSGSLMRRRLREKIGGNRRDTQHRPGFSPSRVRLFRFLKGFLGFFNELILPVENIDQRNSFFLFSLFYSISNKNSKIDLRK